ncbi:NADH:ubiquinone oxidoreductase [Ovoidimarina sediminis]|uniref:NADH:ubiquinone oxidoreductase n=1 Tax=Ovoidimarina sediminis TaxID=3079856 RepID=UPI002915AE82|nr:NADH:ubiquinone oxidoreductase [Rhodophyticola sp. MJ-SS7]MDU8945874.1 NADH:ubiquinone oxidoreductase [Rhodophyticola sp. MJ-SS7]
MAKQTQNSMMLVGVLAGGIALAAFVIMLVMGAGFNVAFFMAALLGLVVAIFLFRAFHSNLEPAKGAGTAPSAQTSAPAPAPAAAAPQPAPEPAPEPEAASEPEPAPEPVADAAPAVASGDGPARLDGPRDGDADDLKKIKGVGPKLEAMLNRMGFYHYDQVASWSEDEVAWVDENLEGFKGRVSRDDWVEQAKVLASGGETEFSKKVEGGDVY